MSKVVNMNSPENTELRDMLTDLLLVRNMAIKDKRPVHRAIREHCVKLQARKPYIAVHNMLEQIRRKQLCEHELMKCITTYNEIVNGELEMIRDGELIPIKGNQAPIE